MFSNVQSYKNNGEYLQLKQYLEDVNDKQGFLGKAWNGFKELTSLGVSESDCNTMLKKFQNGLVSFEEAVKYIEEFDKKQENMSDLLSNVITGVGSIAYATSVVAATTATAGSATILWGAAAKLGAPIGAAIKIGVNGLDRATNDIDDDVFDAKQIIKDGISGAVTGTTSAVSSGIGAPIKDRNLKQTIINAVKCSGTCGALSGAVGYTSDVVLNKDKEFNFGELTKNTVSSSLVSASVGAAVGAGMFNIGPINTTSNVAQVVKDSTTSTARKIGGRLERDILNA